MRQRRLPAEPRAPDTCPVRRSTVATRPLDAARSCPLSCLPSSIQSNQSSGSSIPFSPTARTSKQTSAGRPSILSFRPFSPLIRGRGKPPHTLLYPPQPAPFLFPTGTELLTSSHGGSNGRPWPTSFHPFARAWSHQNRIPLLSSLSPCPRLREWRPGPPIWLSSVSSCPLSWRPGIPRSN